MGESTLSWMKGLVPGSSRSFLRQKLFALLGAPFFRFGHQSFSQAGEDCVLRFLFLDCKISLDQVSYLDIGSRHPTAGSNTCLLYLSGARGVCVDADRTFIELYRQMRPRDKVLNVGVTDSAEPASSLYFMEGGGSTFNREEADKRVQSGTACVTDVVTVPMVHINSLIKAEFDAFPTLLSIDIETLDLRVLKALDFDSFPIPVICVETCHYSENHVRDKDHSIADFLLSKGYEIYADTYINTIFVLSRWFRSPQPGAGARTSEGMGP
ncbi:MAG: hypothetical protein A3E01_08920 [Gammaproteobacteria bacterium RIFCSPHIGHO2_12_FULL_63_22]|nr:MAG: hypothetical protein A3E01_08920 [Gammaproteobacteria bacterium RIFCSPHIGHO2_12_FULL_63_22]